MAIKICSAHFGWLSGVERDRETGKVVAFKWTDKREAAKPFKQGDKQSDRALANVHAAMYDQGIMHDLVLEHVPWIDDT